MRTRKSNRTKSYAIEKYDFDGSSADEEAQEPLERRQQRAEDRDANFDDAEAAQDESDENEDEDEDAATAAVPTSESEASLEEDHGPAKSTRRRIRPMKPFQMKSTGKTAYLDVEPFYTDSHMPRGYAGSFERHARGMRLIELWYGPDQRNIETAQRLLSRWLHWPLLPPAEPVDEDSGGRKGIWDHGIFNRETTYAEKWHARLKAHEPQGTILYPLSEKESRPYRLQPGTLPVLMGPHNSQQELKLGFGESHILSHIGLPFDHDDGESQVPSGWIFDTGGIVLSLDWAQRKGPDSPQLLALAVIPHSDQEEFYDEQESTRPDVQKHGTIQIWEFHGRKHDDASVRPATANPKLLKTLYIDSGRVRRVKWSPVFDHLAILSSNGSVMVLEPLSSHQATYGKLHDYQGRSKDYTNRLTEKVHRALAFFGLEDDVEATAMTWVNFNRVAIGYSDGSIALWSIYPNCLLSRHPAHHSSIVDMVSGYPTMPYLIASIPIGGYFKLMDLRSPSYETTEVPSLAISTTSNTLSWSEHLKGFFALSPSSGVLNTTVGFMHHAHFPIVRRAYACDSFVTSSSVGRTHPFLLVGSTDGSLGALNPQFEIIQLKDGRREVSNRIRVFQHEHRAREHFGTGSPAAERGASRILHGFKPEKNRHDTKGSAKKTKKKKQDVDGIEDDDADNDETSGPVDPSRGISYEPLTRITAVEWNPNEGYGCWAAAAMGSGLVKVMDLGLDI